SHGARPHGRAIRGRRSQSGGGGFNAGLTRRPMNTPLERRAPGAWLPALALAYALTVGRAQCGDQVSPNPKAGEMMPSGASTLAASPTALVATGRRLYLLNCAHCHAQDATGDEGPDLHHLRLSDLRIAARIKNGVKGEMPKFGAKLSDADVSALA